MLASDHLKVLELPRVYLVRMAVFTILICIGSAVLFPNIQVAFMANPGLNGLIVVVLLLGIAYTFRMVFRLWPEVNWVNSFRIANPGLEIPHLPRLLAPMAAQLRDREGLTILSPITLRSLLDSLASRLDEARDISRYMIGLLIFLGLLGTFWGLLQTVSAVGETIRSLNISTAQSGTVFEELKAGLEAPLAGMGTSFSSSLFGLAGSLVLGFLELQASQAQNRFYNDLEDWLATLTDIDAGEYANTIDMPSHIQAEMSTLRSGMDRINRTLETAVQSNGTGPQNAESMEQLAGAVHGLVQQMREEQKVVRQWAQQQSEQNAEIKRMLARVGAPPGRGRS
ncbi:MAG: flagellar motor protein MotA [Anderseniella sp.]|nr:flagellar motor protein MotA [Anderseniella sp.]